MQERTYWFVGALFVLAVLSSSAPKVAGIFVLLIVTVLAIELARGGQLQ